MRNVRERAGNRSAWHTPGSTGHHLLRAFGLVSLFVLALAGWQSVRDTQRFPGFDYRMVTVAARAMNAGFDPYRTQLKTGPDGRPLHPPVPFPAYNRLTFVPPLLSIHGLLADLPYLTQRYIWLAGSWAAFLVSLAAVVQLQRTWPERLLMAAIGVWFFAVSGFWRLHLLQGKYYVLLMALMAAGCWLVVRRGRRSWAAGGPLGLAVALRPTIGLAAVVLWLTGRRPAGRVTLAVAIVASAATLVNVPASAWPDSFAAVRVAGREIRTGWEAAPPEFVSGRIGEDVRLEVKFPEAPREAAVVPWHNLTFARAVLDPMYRQFRWPHWDAWYRLSQLAGLAWAAGWIGLLLLARPRRLPRRLTRRLVVLHAAALVVGLDFFMPDRFTYTDVMYLLPVGLALPLLGRPAAPWWAAAAVLVGLTVGHDRVVPSASYWVSEVRMAGLLFAPAALAGWLLLRRRWAARPAATPSPDAAEREELALGS